MKMKSIQMLFVIVSLLAGVAASAKQVQLKTGEKLEASGATRLALQVKAPAGTTVTYLVASASAFADSITLTDAIIAEVKGRVPASDLVSASFMLLDASGAPLGTYDITGLSVAVAAAPAAPRHASLPTRA